MVYKKNYEAVHDRSIESIERDLRRLVSDRGARVDFNARETVRRADFIGRDLVIVVGGDGTLTSIAHNIGADTPVMGVNSHPIAADPTGSVGFFMGSNPNSFAADLDSALSDNAIENQLPRLQAEIITTSGNRIRCDPALNDLLIANTHQYQPSKYRLQRDADGVHVAIDVDQRSSGMLFSTFVGQGAWFRHVCAIEGIRFPGDEIDGHMLCVARDLPRNDRRDDGSYWAWTSAATTLTSDMHRGYVVSDGWDETHFTRGSTITVDLSGPPLRLLTFRSPIIERLSDWIQ